MEDDCRMQDNDMVPIASPTLNGSESTPLKVSPSSLENGGDGDNVHSHQKNDSVGKYKNLENDICDTSDTTNIGSVQLEFCPPGNGSTWSLQSSTVSTSVNVVRWYNHPKVREHWKVVVASFVLFFIGLCLCVAGIILEALQVQLGGIFMLFVIGVFCFIPGVYHVIAVYYAVKGKRGFSFYNLPLFN